MLNYTELLKQRRAIRAYQDKEVPMEIINDILQDACVAPSSCNHQPWRFVVINDKTMIKRLSDESKKNLLHYIDTNPDSLYKRFEDRLSDPDNNVFYNAPSLIIIAAEKDYGARYIDCTLCATYLMLAATARGLGTCWVNLGSKIQDKKLREEVGLTDDHEIIAPLILGYPAVVPKVYPRNEPVVLKVID